MMYFKSIMIATVLTFGLAACGGGGGDDDNSADNGSNSSSASALNGIYEGTYTEEGIGTFDLLALVQSGRIIAISEEGDTIYSGSIQTTQSGFSGDVTAYAQGGGLIGQSTLQGTFIPKESLNGSFSGEAGNGAFSLSYNPIYDRDSDLSLVNAVWYISDGSNSISVSIDPDGSFTGSDSDGCDYSGNVSIIDPGFNVYQISIDAMNCGPFDGHYAGFAVLTDSAATNDTLVVAALNDNFILVYPFSRQSLS